MRPKILIVDDEDDVRDMLMDLLRLELADTDPVFVALSSAAEAVEWVLEDPHVTAIVCDNSTGGRLNGLGALRTLREHHQRIPFVLYTGDELGPSVLNILVGYGAATCVRKSGTGSLDQIARFVREAIHDERRLVTSDPGPYAAL